MAFSSCHDANVNSIMLLKQHCKLRPFWLEDGVSASGLLECDDSRLRIVQVEEEVGPRGVRDLVRKVSVTTSEYSVPWIVDGDVGGCLLCSAPFTVFRRRHHCRACGILICSSCFADSKIKVKALRRFERSSIVCFKCYDQLLLAHSDTAEKNLRRESVTIPPDGLLQAAAAAGAGQIAIAVAAPILAQAKVQAQAQAQAPAPAPPALKAPPPSTVKKPLTAVILSDASGLGTPETRQHIVAGAAANIVWEADDGLSTPGSTAHISPQPGGGQSVGGAGVTRLQQSLPAFWDDSSADTPEPSTPVQPAPGSAASERYFYTPSSVTGTPSVSAASSAFTPLTSAALLSQQQLLHQQKAATTSSVAQAAATGLWRPPADSPVHAPAVSTTTSIKASAPLPSSGKSAPPAIAQQRNLSPSPKPDAVVQPLTGFSLKVAKLEGVPAPGSLRITNSLALPVRMFINVTHHSAAPEAVPTVYSSTSSSSTTSSSSSSSSSSTVYCVVGPQHQAIDDAGALFSGFDVLVSSTHVTRAFADETGELLRALCVQVMAAVSAQHLVVLSPEFKLLRSATGYLGKSPPPNVKLPV